MSADVTIELIMDKITKRVFVGAEADFCRLLNYGFVVEGDNYVYVKDMADGQMRLTVSVDGSGRVSADVVDNSTGEPFTLFLVDGIEGAFVGGLRAEYESALEDIRDKCFYVQTYKQRVSLKVIDYIRAKYGDEPEFLWGDYPDTAVWRRKDGKKWYGAIMIVSKRKLGLDVDESVEIIDLHADPDFIDAVVDGKAYFRGYHMNKKRWLTVLLDGSVSEHDVFPLIDASYKLAEK